MRRTASKAKSVRRPLRDLSNNNITRSFSKSEIPKKKMLDKDNNQNHASLDRLLLLQSDLSSLLRQIDELVAQAFNLKATEHGTKEIESFTNVISEMLSSLKPWVPRFQKALSNPSAGEYKDQPGQCLESEIVPFVNVNVNEKEKECFDVGSPEETTLGSLISPSPLVSWRAAAADCNNVERGRQLFLLTPLPMSSKRRDWSKSVLERVTSKSTVELPSFLNINGDENDDLLEGVAIKKTPIKPCDSIVVEMGKTMKCGFVSSSATFSKNDHSMLVMTTPCLKMSPPKSCVLLEPIHESLPRGNYGVRKSTPFPLGINSGFSESSSGEDSEDLSLKYPELLGIQRTHKSGIEKKELDSSPTWLFSPPKSCILLEPPDEKSLDNVATDHHFPSAINQQTKLSLLKGNDVTVACQQNKMINQGNTGYNLAPVESTPMWKEPESIMRTSKRPGESTLKKELWTKFEAVSTCGLHYNASAIQRTARKGFLDMLDEVSCDDEGPISDGLI